MRILWVKPGGLWPANTGGRLRSLHMIEELSRDHHVTVLTTRSEDEDLTPLSKRLSRCESVEIFDHFPPKRRSVRFILSLIRSWFSRLPVDIIRHTVPKMKREATRRMASGSVDVCVADFLYAVPNAQSSSGVPVVLFAHNVEYMIWKRLAAVEPGRIRRVLLEVEWRKMRRYERDSCLGADITVAVSGIDCKVLMENAPGSKVTDVPTGVDIDYFKPSDVPEDKNSLVFSGSMDWHPNEDAILYFIESILPLIRNQIPQAHLTVVGRNPSAKLIAVAESENVNVTGTVEDIRPYLAGAAVYIVPLRVGSGTRLKIMEALAMGKAVVSTTIGAEGLALTSNQHLLIADVPREFSEAVVNLMRDCEQRKYLGVQGRSLVAEHFSWCQVTGHFVEKCREVMDKHED